MKKKYKNLEEITNQATYREVMQYLEFLIKTATEKGYLQQPDVENEYTKEIGRLGSLCADYESLNMDLKPLNIKSPLILSIEDQIKKRALNQRQAAVLLGIKENTLSQILNGKRNISMKMAKRLYKILRIDPKTIIEFA